MGDFLTSHLFYSPWYKTQCVQLAAHEADAPQGTVIGVGIDGQSGAATYSVGIPTGGSAYGVLLRDTAAATGAQAVDVIVCGELFRETVNAVYKAANSDNDLPESVVVALRDIGIILK